MYFSNSDQSLDNNTSKILSKNKNYYQKHDMIWIEKLPVISLNYVKIFIVYEWEKYTKAFQEFNSLYQDQKIKYADISILFIDPIRPKDLKLKKSKHCNLIL